MSGNPTSRIAPIPAWGRYGAIAGFLAFAGTSAANLAITWLQPAALCRTGFFTTSPPPDAFGAPPTGPLGVVVTAIGMLFTISFGTGLAVGAAALGGLAGRAMRSQARADRL